MSNPVRIYLLVVAIFCADAFVVALYLYPGNSDNKLEVLVSVALYMDLALTLVLPLAIPALIPASWPRLHAWSCRIGMPYALFLMLCGGAAYAASLNLPPAYSKLTPLAMIASALAMAGNAFAAITLLWPDVRRVRAWIGNPSTH